MSATKIWAGMMVLGMVTSLIFQFAQNIFAAESQLAASIVISQSGPDLPQRQDFDNSLKALNGTDSYERHRAVVALGKSGNKAAVEPLIRALDDTDYLVRSFAASALGNLNDPKAVDPLIKALKDENQRVRRSAAEALGVLKDRRALDALGNLLNDEDALVRRSAVMALGTLNFPEAEDFLIRALGDRDGYVSDGASIALTNIGGTAFPKLVPALADWVLGPKSARILKNMDWQPSSDDERIRLYVAMRNKKALLQEWQTARSVLLSDAKSTNSRQSDNAILALVGIGRDDVLDELAAILRARNSPETAKIFLSSGNSRLSEIARSWMNEHGVQAQPGALNPSVAWGSLEAF